jgi:hypothetical protein
MSESLYIVTIPEDNERYEYEYGCLKHAREHLDTEEQGMILEYREGKQYFVEGKYRAYKNN